MLPGPSKQRSATIPSGWGGVRGKGVCGLLSRRGGVRISSFLGWYESLGKSAN